jgi:hypothetical protein
MFTPYFFVVELISAVLSVRPVTSVHNDVTSMPVRSADICEEGIEATLQLLYTVTGVA